MYRVVISGLASIVFGSAAMAATVQPLQGSVLINQGAGYQSIKDPIEADKGAMVMVDMGGSAQVIYNAQCSVLVKPGNVVTISAEPPCQNTAELQTDSGRMNLGGSCTDKSFCEPPPDRPSWLPIAAITTVVGLCIGDVICDKSTSP